MKNKNLDTIIQQNTLSRNILHREFMNIRNMILRLNGGGFAVARACIDFLSGFFETYKEEIRGGFTLTSDNREYIADKCNCLVHTAGQMYTETNDVEAETAFRTAFRLQEQLATLDSEFNGILTEYYKYEMQKRMNKKIDLTFWRALLDYLSICEKHRTYTDSLKDCLTGFKALEEDCVDNEDISAAIGRVKALATKKVTAFENPEFDV
ncbi:MAG: hypothetical protein LBB30_02975 [Candidatus Methanoplasma sp.]|nr:hypothetical protein [Candidatus Methanoplasma sp.]